MVALSVRLSVCLPATERSPSSQSRAVVADDEDLITSSDEVRHGVALYPLSMDSALTDDDEL